MTALAPTLESFFTDYLIGQRDASPHTVAAYRDTFRLLLRYVHDRTGIRPSALDIAALDATVAAEFLAMLEQQRRNSARTRNARLAAIHSLFTHAALRHPEHADQIARILAIPTKNTRQTVVCWLTDPEVDALLASPDQTTWTGRRDHLLLRVMITTGVRVSEATSLTHADADVKGRSGRIACRGKGRKDRVTPLDHPTTVALRRWLAENPGPATTALFCARGTTRAMTSDAIAQRIALHATSAAITTPGIANKNVTPHVLRHTCAMRCSPPGSTAPASLSGSVTNPLHRPVPTSTPILT